MELTYKEEERLFIKTYTYLPQNQIIKVKGGFLKFNDIILEYDLGLSKVKNYFKFEDPDDLLELEIRFYDNFGNLWVNTIKIDGYMIWGITPINKQYFDRGKISKNLLVSNLKGIIDTRIINKIVVNEDLVETVYEKYLEYKMSLEYEMEKLADNTKLISNIITVHFDFYSEYQNLRKVISYKIFTEDLLMQSLFNNVNEWTIKERTQTINSKIEFIE